MVSVVEIISMVVACRTEVVIKGKTVREVDRAVTTTTITTVDQAVMMAIKIRVTLGSGPMEAALVEMVDPAVDLAVALEVVDLLAMDLLADLRTDLMVGLAVMLVGPEDQADQGGLDV